MMVSEEVRKLNGKEGSLTDLARQSHYIQFYILYQIYDDQ
jgi:hypothetical protein